MVPVATQRGAATTSPTTATSTRFGTLADAEALFDAAHAHDIKVIVDLVPNHTSSEHPWFKAALAAAPDPPSALHLQGRQGPEGARAADQLARGVRRPGVGAASLTASGTYLFDPAQPDLNWENEEVRAEFDAIFRFWLDRGADGFRIDVAHGLVKDPRGYPTSW